MNAIMGRDIQTSFAALLLGHFAVALLYAVLLGTVVYRFRLLPALGIGLAVGAVLYFCNFAIFNALGGVMQTGEARAVTTHAVFMLFATLVYKAAGVPRPRATKLGEDVAPSAPADPQPLDASER